MSPDEASDHIEITELLARYAWAIDGRRPDLFAAVFTPDIEADYGPFGSFSDLVVLASRFDEYHAQFATTQHMITNAFIEVDGDRAMCRSYFQATMVYVQADDQRDGCLRGSELSRRWLLRGRARANRTRLADCQTGLRRGMVHPGTRIDLPGSRGVGGPAVRPDSPVRGT